MENEVKVTVICPVYNHEKYLRKTLDGFLMQKTDFKFNVIVHDDVSSDGSAEIMREYEKKYPQLFHNIYEKENQYSKHVSVPGICLKHTSAKYIALCEGDDFWTDEYKLQKQFNAMEAHPDCHSCLTKVKVVEEDGETFENYLPQAQLETGVMNTREMLEADYFHTSSYFCLTKDYIKYLEERDKIFPKCGVGDELELLYFASLGNNYYINEVMSCYRHFSNGGWSATHDKLKHLNEMKALFSAFNVYTKNLYADIMQDRTVFLEFYTYLNLKDYKKVLNKKYSKYFKQLNCKYRLKIRIGRIFPRLIKKYESRKGE